MTADDHGSASTYNNHRCRCDDCRRAKQEVNRRMHAERVKALEEGRVVVPHGRYSTYSSYDCRCEDCREAVRKHRRARSAR